MCKEYVNNKQDEMFMEKAEKYYGTILKVKKVNIDVRTYFEIFAGKNQFKKMIREIVLFHFPVLGYFKFARVKAEKC